MNSGIKFHHLSVDEGLSQGSIHSIVQDVHGFLWFATKDGLNKYDGYTFTVYRNIPDDSTSLPANFVSALAIDAGNNFWVGTNGGGLSKFNPDNETFERIDLNALGGNNIDYSSISEILISHDNKVWFTVKRYGLCVYDPVKNTLKSYSDIDSGSMTTEYEVIPILEDSNNNIWFASLYNGVIKLNPATGKFVHYKHTPGDRRTICDKVVSSIEEDAEGNIFISTNDGLNKYDISSGKISRIPLVLEKMSDRYPFDRIRDIKCDGKGNLWIATLGAGILKLNLQSYKVEAFVVSSTDEFSISNNTIETLFIDKTGSLWIGTNGMGIDIYFPYSKNFHTLEKNPNNFTTSGFGSLRAILVEPDNTMWIGGYNGLMKYDKILGILDVPPTNIKNVLKSTSSYLINRAVYSLLPDPKSPGDVLWIGTEGSGLIRYDLKTKIFRNFYFWDNGMNYPEIGMQVYKIVKSADGNLLLGTVNGLVKFNVSDFSFKLYKHDPADDTSVPAGNIKSIIIDSKNNIWVGSDLGGFAKFNENDGTFSGYHVARGDEGLSSNIVNQIFEDSKGRYWAATAKGLNRFYYPENKFKKYTTKDGLPNDVIYGILEDKTGAFWLSTNNGLSRFDPEKETFRNYTKSDGLQGNEFNGGAYYKDKNGILYFGGTKGLTFFNSQEINENPFPPEVVITSINIIDDSLETYNHIDINEPLRLDYNDDIIQFHVAALNFQNPENNNYAYKLEGFNNDFIHIGNKRDITFTRLDPGKYVLNIIASNNDGVWNDKGIEITLVVSPPFWQTEWFIALLISMIVTSVYLFMQYKLRASRIQKERLEKIVVERTSQLENSRQELEEANRAKDKLFSIIAHDMKNPFNSLLGFSQLLIQDFEKISDKEKKEYAEEIVSASKSAYNLLENLLDWSRIQMHRVEIEKQVLNLNEIIDYNVKLVSMSAKNKDITIAKLYIRDYNIYADKYTFETIIRNLLTNAVKFTSTGGEIKIEIKELHDTVLISIIDNGVGIPDEMQASLFHLRNSHSSFGTEGEKGTGLGLILCKEFIEANGGEIFVESIEGKGSTFSITIPKEK